MSQDPRDLLVALARPVRHEVNNLLAALSGTAELMLRAKDGGKRGTARAERLGAATARMQVLLHAYLALGAPPPADTPAATVLETMQPLVRLALGRGRVAEVEAAAGLPRLAGCPGALQAAILHLAFAAAPNMPPNGCLRMTLEPAEGGAMLTARISPEGDAPPPVFLPAAPP